jgi:catechol 2,3-dioxygenase-like lactoylglutathione lyase family enzyme
VEIVGIDHVQLAMPPRGETAARRFYGALLGLAEQPKPPHLAERGGCWFERAGVKLHLGVDPDFRPARKAHPALLVTDLRALAERLKAEGCPTRSDEPLDGYDRLFVDDPFGNRIELMERRRS